MGEPHGEAKSRQWIGDGVENESQKEKLKPVGSPSIKIRSCFPVAPTVLGESGLLTVPPLFKALPRLSLTTLEALPRFSPSRQEMADLFPLPPSALHLGLLITPSLGKVHNVFSCVSQNTEPFLVLDIGTASS